MAQDEKGNLLQALADGRRGVPARRDERGLEPSESGETGREKEKGRSPEEVVGDRAARPAPVAEGEDVKLPKKWKVRVDDGSGEPVVRELTLEQLEEQGLLDKLLVTASQFPGLNKKHQELLERVAGKELDKPTATPPEKKEIDPVQFWSNVVRVYQPLVEASIQLNVQSGWMEPDLVEAYPQTTRTLFTRIFYQQDQIEELTRKLNIVIGWATSKAEAEREARVANLVIARIEELAAKGDGEKGDPLFRNLRTKAVHDAFVQWLVTELDPKVASLTAENMERYWFAFNARGILDFSKEAVKKPAEPPPSKRRAASDGTGARQGVREAPQEKSLLDKLSESRLGPEA